MPGYEFLTSFSRRLDFEIRNSVEEEVHEGAIRRMRERILAPDSGILTEELLGTLLVVTNNDYDEMDLLKQITDDDKLPDLFAAVICDGFATKRYLFITRDQVPSPTRTEEIDGFIQDTISSLMGNPGGFNGIQVRNAMKYPLFYYPPVWSEDIFDREDGDVYQPWAEFVDLAKAHRQGENIVHIL